MSSVYNRLLQNLDAIKYDLIEMDNPQLNVCIHRIKDVIFDVGRLNMKLTKLQAIQEITKKNVDLDVCDCWD